MWLWQMPIEIVFSTKCFQTNFTNVRTFSSMSEDVSNHVNLLLGLFGTKWAPKSINIKLNRIILQNRRKRAIFRMGTFICWQFFFFNLIVQNWRVLLLHMPGEWIFPTKTGMAHWALMRFFPSMYQNMPFQISDVFGFHNHITKRTLIFVWIQKHRSKILQFHEKFCFYWSVAWSFITWIFKWSLREKAFGQYSQTCGLTPVWILICLLIFLGSLPSIVRLQSGHWNIITWLPNSFGPSIIGLIWKKSRYEPTNNKETLFLF